MRCTWCGDDPLYIDYHDNVWGHPVTDDRTWFEFLILEGAQAGLSWITILRKRENYLKAFHNFDPNKVASMTNTDVEKLLQNEGIIRNRRKIESAIQNANAFIKVQQEHGSFHNYIWAFVDGKPIQNNLKTMGDIPAQSELSQKISKDLKKRGFNFVGPTIVYAFMQATGLVNDHITTCPQHKIVQQKSKTFI